MIIIFDFNCILKEWNNNETDVAVQDLVCYLNEHKNDMYGYLLLSVFLVELNDFVQAEELIIKSLHKFDDNLSFIYMLGILYYCMGKYDDSLLIFLKIKDNQNVKEDSYFMIAELYFKLGDNKKALAYALTCLDIDNSKSDSNILVADIMIQLQMFNEAREYLSKAINMDNQSSSLYFKYGLLSMITDHEYISYFKKSKSLDSKYFIEHKQQVKNIIKFLNATKGTND